MPTTTIRLAEQVFPCTIKEINNTNEGRLGLNERIMLKSFKLDKRKREWLAGRRAAKEAVRKLVFPDTLEGLEILTKTGGEPYAVLSGSPRNDIHVSISHSNEVALAVAGCSPIIGLGIDVEVVENRGDSFLRTAFTPEERKIFQKIPDNKKSLLSAFMYTMKEAVTKALGIGLSVNTYDVELLAYMGKISMSIVGENFLQSQKEQWKVVLHNEAKARLTELGGSEIIVGSIGLMDLIGGRKGEIIISKKYAVGLAVAR